LKLTVPDLVKTATQRIRRDVAYAIPEEKLLLILTRERLDGSKTYRGPRRGSRG
jgi:hypothetical protein